MSPDTDNICKNKNLAQNNRMAHPYNCSKYIECAGDGTFIDDGDVFKSNEGHVFNPKNGQHELPENVKCSNLTGKFIFQDKNTR